MANERELLGLAERIAAKLPNVSRNEWMRWMEVERRQGLEVAVRLAEHLRNDFTMRPAVRKAYQDIDQAIKAHRAEIERLPPDQRRTVFGFVAWHLRIRAKCRVTTARQGNESSRRSRG